MPTRTFTTSFADDVDLLDAVDGETRLQPIGQRGWSRAMLPFCTIFTPIYVTALVVADSHRLLPILAALAGTVLIAVGLIDGFASANIQLRADGILHSGILPPARFVPGSEIAAAVILQVYDTESLRTTTQLFLLDSAERTRFRMRGRYWTDEQIEQVAAHFDVPIERIDEPLTRVELRTARRSQLEWAERRPLLGAAVVVLVGGLIAFAIVGATLLAIGTADLPIPVP